MDKILTFGIVWKAQFHAFDFRHWFDFYLLTSCRRIRRGVQLERDQNRRWITTEDWCWKTAAAPAQLHYSTWAKTQLGISSAPTRLLVNNIQIHTATAMMMIEALLFVHRQFSKKKINPSFSFISLFSGALIQCSLGQFKKVKIDFYSEWKWSKKVPFGHFSILRGDQF